MPLPTPIPFARYLLLERIAASQAVEIFRACVKGQEDGQVAIKRVLPEVGADVRARFIDEARLASHLVHPNIVQVHELGEEAGQHYLVMDYVDGVDASRIWRTLGLRQERVPATLALHITSEVLKALDHAHCAVDPSGRPLGIIHRDVSLSNILVTHEGDVLLSDFGAALMEHELANAPTESDRKLGYMAPEQVAGSSADPRADIFSAGVCLAELLLGRRLFVGKTAFETLSKQLRVDLEILDRYQADVPREVLRIVRRALERQPADRYATARQFNLEIHEYLAASGVRVGREHLAAFLSEFVVPHLAESRDRIGGREELRDPSVELVAVVAPPAPPRPAAALTPLPSFNAPVGTTGGGTLIGYQAPPRPAEEPAKVAKMRPPATAPAEPPRTHRPAPVPEPALVVPPRVATPTPSPDPALVDASPRARKTPPRDLPDLPPAPRAELPSEPLAAEAAPDWSDATLYHAPPDPCASPTLEMDRDTIASGAPGMETSLGGLPVYSLAAGSNPSLELELDSGPPLELDQPSADPLDTSDTLELDMASLRPTRMTGDLPAVGEAELWSEDEPLAAEEPGLAARPVPEPAPEPAPDDQGSLSARTVANVLFHMYTAGHTGLLELRGPRDGTLTELSRWLRELQLEAGCRFVAPLCDAQRCWFHLEDGEAHLAWADHYEEALIAQLIEAGALSRDRLSEIVRANSQRRLLAALVAAGALPPLHVPRHLTQVVLGIVLRAFRWVEGEYSFFRGRPPSEDQLPTGAGTLQIIARGVDSLDEAALDRRLGQLGDTPIMPNPSPPATIEQLAPSPLLLDVHAALYGGPSVSGILAALRPREVLEAKRALYLLVECELALPGKPASRPLARLRAKPVATVAPSPLQDRPPLTLDRPVRGALGTHPLAWLLVQAAFRGVTGTLKLDRGVERKLVHLRDGKPVFVDSNLRTETLGAYLVATGVVDQKRLNEALRQTWSSSSKLGEMLVQLGIVDEKTLREALEMQVHAKLASAVAWTAGSFVFTPGADAATAFCCEVEPVGLVLHVLLRGVHPGSAAEALLPYLQRRVRLNAAGERFRARIDKVMGDEALGHILSGGPLSSLDSEALRVQVYALRVAGLIDIA